MRDFLVGWQVGDYALAGRRTDGDPRVVAKALEDTRVHLDAASFRFKIKSLTRNGDESTAGFSTVVDLGDNNSPWGYTSRLPLHLVDGVWKVRWSPSVIHPQLHEGLRFAVKSESQARRPVLDRTREPLQTDTEVYVAGVTPLALGDAAEKAVERLAGLTGFAQDRMLSRIKSAPPSDFVPLVTFSRVKYRLLEARLTAIPGVTVREESVLFAPLPPKQIVGTVSALSAETEQKLGGPQHAGDSVGLTGLQKAYQDNLTGSTRTSVVLLDLKNGKQAAELKTWSGRSTVPIETTIDSTMQAAAETVLAESRSAALVAVKASTGEVLAVSTSENLNEVKDGLAGRYPAGTTFSIIAAEALLKKGVKPNQRLTCPAERSVGGAEFEQAGLTTTVTQSFQSNFAKSCVTALASLARRVSADELNQAAADFGIGKPWKLPLKSFSGTLGPLSSDADKAKAIAGQNVEVSPLTMALLAGAVAKGTWRPPLLVVRPATPDSTTVRLPAPVPIDAKTLPVLRAMMRAGVTTGSAAAAASDGEEVSGITAPVTGKRRGQAWFVGWQGDVAVAVIAENANPAAYAGRFFQAQRRRLLPRQSQWALEHSLGSGYLE
ncbi:penicillin-binding transpeptidase domain-containing protein [Nonomuraea sp. MG754425]|uniref:penicillin-binding transpeptidase domain-containing protein n=1 Tax=Nonomuraea sp. MG754425 TaxID=2570319 RepID=UPI001F29EB0C|nr:penicillin-binding transpeptidase domain-containing protein [Nonomuraea sp. MG754425]